MTVRKRGPNQFQVDVALGRQRWRLNAVSLSQGEAWEAAIRADVEAGRVPDIEALRNIRDLNAPTLSVAVEMVKTRRWSQTRSADTATFNINRAIRLLGPNKLLASITVDDIYTMIDAMEGEGLSNGTINRTLSALRVVLKLAHEWHLTDTAHTAPPRIEQRRESEGRIRFLQPGEEQKLFGMALHLGLHDAADYWTVLLDTGARAREVLGIEWSDLRLNAAGHPSHVTFWRTKGDKPRTIPLTERSGVVLQRRRQNAPGPFTFDYDRARSWWDRVKERLGLSEDDQWVMHMLRHTCISWLVQRGAPLMFVQEWAGHKRIETTMRYAHLCPSNLDGLVAMLQPNALVAELVDASDLGSDLARGGGSSPSGRTNQRVA